MNNSLCIHAGGKHATIDQVANVITPAPVDQHYPIPHIQLYEAARKQLQLAGCNIVHEEHALHTVQGVEAANYFSLLEVEHTQEEYALVIGLRNSHVKQYAAGFVLGSRVFVCDNLAFSGEVKLQRKHTRFIIRDLPQVMAAAVGRLNAVRINQDARIEAYKDRILTLAEADHAIIEMLRARCIPSSDILKVLTEYEDPEHQEQLGVDGERTVWTLFNAVTKESTKGTNIMQLPRKTQALHGVCDALAGLHAPQEKLERAA